MKYLIGFLIFNFAIQSLADEPKPIYRKIETTRAEFLDALRTVQTPEEEASQQKSRMQKFVKITKKTVVGSKIEMQIEVKTKFLPDSLKKYSAIHLTLDEIDPIKSNPRFKVNFEFAKMGKIEALMTVFAEQKTCSVQLEIQHSTLPSWILDAAMGLIVKLNLANSSPKDNK